MVAKSRGIFAGAREFRIGDTDVLQKRVYKSVNLLRNKQKIILIENKSQIMFEKIKLLPSLYIVCEPQQAREGPFPYLHRYRRLTSLHLTMNHPD